ncbi:MAG: transglycosylase SLT domain-containing protein, partial [Myxococcaceae bacterium]
ALLKQFDGKPALAIAAYNAGPTAVAKWVKERPDLDTDELVEEIPFGETRHYVKRVLASHAAYRLLARSEATQVASR